MIIIHGVNEASFLPRLLTPLVEEALRRFPVVIVTGVSCRSR